MLPRLPVVLFLLVVAACTFEDGPPEWRTPPTGPHPGPAPVLTGQHEEIVLGFHRLNEIRMAAGLAPVAFDEEMSRWATLHCHYLLINKGRTNGASGHSEDPSLPGYTPEGAEAGRRSGLSGLPPSRAIDNLVDTLYHRLPLLSPTLEAVGIGWDTLDGDHETAVMTRHAAVRTDYPIAYPHPGMLEVPYSFHSEIPNPLPVDAPTSGYPVTLEFGMRVTDVEAALFDEDGRELPAWISTPDRPATAYPQDTYVCILAKDALLPGRRYTAQVSALQPDGRRAYWRWSFTTKTATDVDALDEQGLEALVGRMVRVTGAIITGGPTSTGQRLRLAAPGTKRFDVWIGVRAWRSFTQAGIEEPTDLSGTEAALVGRLGRTETGYDLGLAHAVHMERLDRPPLRVDTADAAAFAASQGRPATLRAVVVKPTGTPSDATPVSVNVTVGTRAPLTVGFSARALAGLDGPVDPASFAARVVSVTGVPYATDDATWSLRVDRADQWSFVDAEPAHVDADVPGAITASAGSLALFVGTVTHTGESDHKYLALGPDRDPTNFVHLSEAAWSSLAARGVESLTSLRRRRVEILAAPAGSDLFVSRGDQITLLP